MVEYKGIEFYGIWEDARVPGGFIVLSEPGTGLPLPWLRTGYYVSTPTGEFESVEPLLDE